MDLTFPAKNGFFNYRVCAVIKHGGRLLAMKDNNTRYYYLPGGRVKFNEPAEKAIKREMTEELGIEAIIVRPLWLCQGFFVEDETGETFHELCIYFLVDVSDTDIIRKDSFKGTNTKKEEIFEWLDTDTLGNQYLYPRFIKEKINDLPENFELLTEWEY